MCCHNGDGSYTLYTSTDIIASGSKFTSFEAKEFCNGNTLGVENQIEKSDSFKIYPVPTIGVLNISSSDADKIDKIKVFSVYGQLVKDVIVDGTKSKIDVSNLPEGTYFARIIIEDNKSEIIKKFVVSK